MFFILKLRKIMFGALLDEYIIQELRKYVFFVS